MISCWAAMKIGIAGDEHLIGELRVGGLVLRDDLADLVIGTQLGLSVVLFGAQFSDDHGDFLVRRDDATDHLLVAHDLRFDLDRVHIQGVQGLVDPQLAIGTQTDVFQVSHRGHFLDRVDPLGKKAQKLQVMAVPVPGNPMVAQRFGGSVIVLRKTLGEDLHQQTLGIRVVTVQADDALQFDTVLIVRQHQLAYGLGQLELGVQRRGVEDTHGVVQRHHDRVIGAGELALQINDRLARRVSVLEQIRIGVRHQRAEGVGEVGGDRHQHEHNCPRIALDEVQVSFHE